MLWCDSPDDKRSSRALHGLTRSLIQNMVNGVVKPFEKKLEIIGVGYNANLAGTKLTLQVGFANKIVLEVPAGVKCEVPDATHVIVKSSIVRRVVSLLQTSALFVRRNPTRARAFVIRTNLFVVSPVRRLVPNSCFQIIC